MHLEPFVMHSALPVTPARPQPLVRSLQLVVSWRKKVCIVAKRCVLEQKLYWQPIGSRMWRIDCYQNEWPWPLFRGRFRSYQPSRHIRRWISRKPLEIGLWLASKGPSIGYCQLSLSAHIAAVCCTKCLLPAAPATAGCPVIFWRCK